MTGIRARWHDAERDALAAHGDGEDDRTASPRWRSSCTASPRPDPGRFPPRAEHQQHAGNGHPVPPNAPDQIPRPTEPTLRCSVASRWAKCLTSPLGTASVNETSRRDDFHSTRVPVLGSYYAEERRKVMKRFVAILATVGATAAVGAALAPVAFAAPGPNANCTAGEATGNHDISFYAKFPHPGGPSFVGDASSSDCGTR
jgi:hypothetical protein